MKANDKHSELQNLIILVREGDQEAFAKLLELYNPLVMAEVHRHADGLSVFDREDLRQSAWMALYRAAKTFDLSQEDVKFGLYAKVCISNALASQLRELHRRTTEMPWEEACLGEGDHGEGDPARFVMEEENLRVLCARIRSLLSPFENRVWSLFMAGLSVKEIGRRLGKEPRSIENAVYRIRQKLRSGIDKDD